MDEEQVSKQLDAVLDLMYQYKIVLDTLAEYPDRLLYRFITKEFFQMEIDLPGDLIAICICAMKIFIRIMIMTLRQATRYFVNFIIDDLSLVPQDGLYTRVRTSSGLIIGYKEAVSVIRASRTEFSSL